MQRAMAPPGASSAPDEECAATQGPHDTLQGEHPDQLQLQAFWGRDAFGTPYDSNGVQADLLACRPRSQPYEWNAPQLLNDWFQDASFGDSSFALPPTAHAVAAGDYLPPEWSYIDASSTFVPQGPNDVATALWTTAPYVANQLDASLSYPTYAYQNQSPRRDIHPYIGPQTYVPLIPPTIIAGPAGPAGPAGIEPQSSSRLRKPIDPNAVDSWSVPVPSTNPSAGFIAYQPTRAPAVRGEPRDGRCVGSPQTSSSLSIRSASRSFDAGSPVPARGSENSGPVSIAHTRPTSEQRQLPPAKKARQLEEFLVVFESTPGAMTTVKKRKKLAAPVRKAALTTRQIGACHQCRFRKRTVSSDLIIRVLARICFVRISLGIVLLAMFSGFTLLVEQHRTSHKCVGCYTGDDGD